MSEKITYIKSSSVKSFFKNQKKQLSKEALVQLEEAFKKVMFNTLRATGHFKRVKEEEVLIGNSGLFNK